MFAGYLMLIFGEIDFYRKIARAEKAFQVLNGLRAPPLLVGDQALNATRRRLQQAGHWRRALLQQGGAAAVGLAGAPTVVVYGNPDGSFLGAEFTQEDFLYTPQTGVFSTNATGGDGWLEYAFARSVDAALVFFLTF
jgi:negative regulator of sigma E activity